MNWTTYGDKYHPAMAITDEEEARRYFELCVEDTMRDGHSREEAEKIEKNNLVYFAGYYDAATVRRVERLFGGVYPGFGNVIRLNAEETERLARDIENPPPPNEALKEAWASYKEAMGGDILVYQTSRPVNFPRGLPYKTETGEEGKE